MPLGLPRLRIRNDSRMNYVGVRVKERRLHMSLTQDQLCGRIAEVTHGAWVPTWRDIYRVEAGTRIVSDLEAVALAVAINSSLAWLLDDNNPNQPPAHVAHRFFGPDEET